MADGEKGKKGKTIFWGCIELQKCINKSKCIHNTYKILKLLGVSSWGGERSTNSQYHKTDEKTSSGIVEPIWIWFIVSSQCHPRFYLLIKTTKCKNKKKTLIITRLGLQQTMNKTIWTRCSRPFLRAFRFRKKGRAVSSDLPLIFLD